MIKFTGEKNKSKFTVKYRCLMRFSLFMCFTFKSKELRKFIDYYGMSIVMMGRSPRVNLFVGLFRSSMKNEIK